MNGIELELMWSNLRSVVSEQAKAMQRTAFSAVVREAGDLAYGLFDAQGRMIVQAETGTPGHINCLAACGEFLAKRFHNNLEPGDILITNDPWTGAGHNFDITIFAPIFRNDRILGFVGSTNHHHDIGGVGTNASAHDVHEEGLWIPPAKLYERGVANELLFDIIKCNVRTPAMIAGDLAAQVATCRSGGEALNELCDRYDLDDIQELSDGILEYSERAMRDAIRRCPAGTWEAETKFDIPGGEVVTLRAKVTVDKVAGDLIVDFAGSSDQVGRGVNVVLNYTRAYSTFAVRSVFSPELPNNLGSITPVKVVAPEGSIVNCLYPAPVAARHIVGMYLPATILKALHQVVPDQVVAPSPGCPIAMQVFGNRSDGERFIVATGLTGGMGARANKPGLAATYYPAGLGMIPIEILESDCPVVFDRFEIRHGSGGAGRMRGGDGQIIEFHVDTETPWMFSASASSVEYPPEGLGGGGSGKAGVFQINNVDALAQEGRLQMSPHDVVHIETPGGGGFGALQ